MSWFEVIIFKRVRDCERLLLSGERTKKEIILFTKTKMSGFDDKDQEMGQAGARVKVERVEIINEEEALAIIGAEIVDEEERDEELRNSRRIALELTNQMRLQGSLPDFGGEIQMRDMIAEAGQLQLNGIIPYLNNQRDEFVVRENLRKSRLVAMKLKKYVDTQGPIRYLGDDGDLEAMIGQADQEQLDAICRQPHQECEIFFDENQRKQRNPRQERQEEDEMRSYAMGLKRHRDAHHRIGPIAGEGVNDVEEELLILTADAEMLRRIIHDFVQCNCP